MRKRWFVPQEQENLFITAAAHAQKEKVSPTDLSEIMVGIANPNTAIRAVSNDEACECEAGKLTLALPPPSPEQLSIIRCPEKGYTTRPFRNSGLTGTEEIDVSEKLYLEFPEKYWEFMLEIAAPIANALGKATEEQQIRIAHEIMNEIESFSENGQIALPWTAYAVTGKKAK